MKKTAFLFLIFICLNCAPEWNCIGEITDFQLIDGGLLGSKYYLVEIDNDQKYVVRRARVAIGKTLYWEPYYHGYVCK